MKVRVRSKVEQNLHVFDFSPRKLLTKVRLHLLLQMMCWKINGVGPIV